MRQDLEFQQMDYTQTFLLDTLQKRILGITVLRC